MKFDNKCIVCRVTYIADRKNAKFCSRVCSDKHYAKLPQTRFRNYKSSSTARGHDFDLTMDEFMIYWQSPCSYCGAKIETIGLDRVDNSIGYTPENIIPCCRICNIMKQDMTTKEFIDHIIKIVRYK